MLQKTIKILSAILILITVLLGYAYFIEPNTLKTENETFKLNCLKENLPGNFVQVSDLHFTEKTTEKWISRIYEKVAESKPAAVFITGDFISNEAGINPAKKLVKKITESYPVYAVFGNWDYWALDSELDTEFKKELEKSGAKVLMNENIDLKIKGENINLIGVNDPYTSKRVRQDLEAATKNIAKDDKSCKILLAHSPDVIKAAVEKNIDLVLVGHTHGGQINTPFITERLIPSNQDGKGFVKGLYKVSKTQMYVNRGIGTSVLPLRFLVPPEVTVITLEAVK